MSKAPVRGLVSYKVMNCVQPETAVVHSKKSKHKMQQTVKKEEDEIFVKGPVGNFLPVI